MGFIASFRARISGAKAQSNYQSDGPGVTYSPTDPQFLELLRGMVMGGRPGILLNGAINRSIRLHSESIGMLPLHFHWKDEAKAQATDHPLYTVLHVKPNNWQTPFEFKRLMQSFMLNKGASYAQIVKSRGQIIQLQPLAKFNIQPKQTVDWSIIYDVTSPNGVKSTLKQDEMFVLRDLDLNDGVTGSSRVDQAREAIDISRSIKKAAQKLFDNGMNVGGALSAPAKLSNEARENIKKSMAEKTGAENSGKWLLLEEGMKAEKLTSSLSESLQVDNLNAAIEEIARIFGIPRPLLMMDETSWGSGIDALGLFFIQYGLAPQFVNWEQAIQRSLMTDEELLLYEPKFNDGALLRGSKKDQADFFAKALGAGGSDGWMTKNEVRALQDLPSVDGGDVVPARMQQTGSNNVPPPAP